MAAQQSSNLGFVDLPLQTAKASLVESLASTTPWLYVALLLVILGMARLFSRGRSQARRSVRWFIRYWQAFFGLKYSPTSKSNLRKRHSRARNR